VKLVVFDLDGTLSDSISSVEATLQLALAAHDLPPADPIRVRALIGTPLDDICEAFAPGRGLAVADVYRQRYNEVASTRERLYDGVLDLLSALRSEGRRLAIATGKSQHGADAATARLGLRERVDGVFGVIPGTPGKPHPHLLERVLAELGHDREEAVVVGDSGHDLQMAAAAGVPAIGVTWGCWDRPALEEHGPLGVAEDLAALRRLLG
jgi:phosphoglycolate phosphatase